MLHAQRHGMTGSGLKASGNENPEAEIRSPDNGVAALDP
jgi:hypothetical protein